MPLHKSSKLLKVATTSSFILPLAAASFITTSAAADEVHPATTAEATQNAPALYGFESYTPTAVVPVNYNQSVNTPIYIEQIKEIRARAWDANLPFNGIPLQKATANAVYDRESYINDVTWNNELEQEAIIRAAELHVNFDHTRPSGSSS